MKPAISSALRFQVEFAHTDMGGVMFFGRYIELAHRAYEHLVRHQLGLDWNQWFNNPDWLVPVRALYVEYLSPLTGGSECQIEAHIVKVGTSSFTHSYTFLSQEKKVTIVSLTSVFVDKHSFRKIPIPSAVHEALKQQTGA